MQDNIRNQLINNPLEYRSLLTIPRSVRFGLEIELENVDFEKVYYLVRKQFGTSFIVKPDKSLIKEANAEIAVPVMTNEKKHLIILKKLAELLSRMNPTFDNCGFQINFDGCLLPTLDDRIKFLKLYAYYEDIIYRFSKGEDVNYRKSLDMYASPIILALKDIVSLDDEDKELFLERFSNNKRYGITFKTDKKDLIEFRTPNGTINPILWQNYLTLFYYLLVFVHSNRYNTQEMNEYIRRYSRLNVLESYELCREEKAITLAKSIFNNQKDKIYFLHQYLGR